MQQDAKHTYYAADIFSGAGGLTTGLKSAGFKMVAGVERDSAAVSTYKVNHPEVQIYKQDVQTVSGSDLLKCSPTGNIHLLAGCPPCQGFTSLTSKYRRKDDRNQLVLEMARLTKEIKPEIIMMENVPGLSTKGVALFSQLLRELSDLGYVCNWGILQVADYGIPQSRKRLVMMAGKGFAIALPRATHSREKERGIAKWVAIKHVLRGRKEPIDLEQAKLTGGPNHHNWNVVRTMSEINKKRLKYAKAGKSWRSIPQRLRPACHLQSKRSYFGNVYGRMSWDEVSPTITGGCTTLSKGRFGHPSKDRTISVREAALLQTFPETYVFSSPFIDSVCEMIGNAFPCDFAKILAETALDSLKKRCL